MSIPENLTLKNILKDTVDRFPQRPALAFVESEPLTYQQFYEQVQLQSQNLHENGIIVGDRVAILSQNMPNWAIAFFSITSIGAVAVPILPEFRANQVHHILRHSGSKAIFISRQLKERIDEFDWNLLNCVILIDDLTLLQHPEQSYRFQEVMKEGGREFAKLKEKALKITGRIHPEVQPDDIASIIYTSGTTGHSKGVVLTHKNIIYDAWATTQIQSVTEHDRLLSILPLAHTIECTLGLVIPVLQGSVVYYLGKPPTARVMLPAMEKIKPTMMLVVPLIIEKIYKANILAKFTKKSMIRRLYKMKFFRKKLHQIAAKKLFLAFGGKLKFFGIGGAPLAPEVELFLREGKFPYAIGYGLTETSPLLAGTSPDKTRYRSAGLSLPGIELKIENPNPTTGEGEVLARGPNIMQGYYKDPERTTATFTSDGWLRTGDLGMFDKDGYLYLKGRSKNMILGPNGENIYPEEIESVINQFDFILESLVYEVEGHLVARVHLNYEELDQEFASSHFSESQVKIRIQQLLEEMREQINQQVTSFSRINKIIEQPEPFEKTPTLKIKRYLYVN
ncbi:AMP-binding protein [candidate division KSB1 bacterium]|nr:AMP-binding protein [candidate division KSB1 bacterium]